MKKVIYESKGVPVLTDVAVPECKPDTFLLKTVYSAISNGTERNMMLGGNYNAKKMFPHMFVGYQATSEVVQRGDQITNFKVGDKVATGTFGVHSEYHVAKESDLICKLPEGFDLLSGSFLSVASVAYHDAKRCAVKPGDKVLVCGAGLIGQFALQACKLMGAHTTLLNRSEPRARVGLELGADAIIFGSESEIVEALDVSKPYDVVIETTGSQILLNTLIGTAVEDGVFSRRGRARLAIIGGMWDISLSSNACQRAELAVVFAQHYVQEDLEEMVDHFHKGRIQARPLIKDIIKPDEAVSIYETLRDNPSTLFGTVIDWT